MEIFARMENEGNFDVVAELEEDSINVNGLVNYYDFSDTKLIDRKLCMKVDNVIATTRDTYPDYTSFDSDWFQGDYDVNPTGTSYQKGLIDVRDYNMKSMKFNVCGEVLVEESSADYDLTIGLVCRYLNPDGTENYHWRGVNVGSTNDLKEQGWVDVFQDFNLNPGYKIICIKPWIQISKQDTDGATHRILCRNITIEPKFETIERYTIARYVKLVCSGAISPLSDVYINHNNLYKVEVIDVNGNNVALGKNVTVSRDDYESRYEPPENIVTDRPQRWNEYTFSADKPDVEYIIDLGDKYKIKNIRVNERNFSTRKYLDKVYTSVDKNTWSLLNDTYTPFKNNEKKIFNDLPVTPHTDNEGLEYSLFGDCYTRGINSATPLASLASFLANVLIFDKSVNTNIKWILDDSAPTASRVVAKYEAPTGDLINIASCRVETKPFTITNFDNMCFATAWVKVDKNYNGGPVNLSIEECDTYKVKASQYDLNRKGEWQKLTVYTTWEVKDNARYFAFVRNIWRGSPTWTEGSVYVSELTFGGNPFNSNNFPYIENLYPTTFYKAPVANIKNKGALFIEFDLNCFNNREWMSFFHIYSTIEGNVENKKINLIFNNRAKQLQVRINSDIRRIYSQGEYKAIDNRLCIKWGDDGVYSILNGIVTKLSDTNIITGDYEDFCLGCWDKDRLEANNNIYKLAIYNDTFTLDDAVQLTKPNSSFSLTDNVIETKNIEEGYNFSEALYKTGFSYFQLSDSFKEYYDKNIELKNIYAYNDTAYFRNDALFVTPRYMNRWLREFNNTDYRYSNVENKMVLPTLAYSNTVLTVSFNYNTLELGDEELKLNLTCFTDSNRDETRQFTLERTGETYKEFSITIPMVVDKNKSLEFFISGEGYARLRDITVCPVAYITPPDIRMDETKKLAFAVNLKESIGHNWESGFTIFYKKKAVATSNLNSNKQIGYIIDAFGSYGGSRDKGYIYFGKYSTSNELKIVHYSQRGTNIQTNTLIDIDMLYEWYTVVVSYNPITKRIKVYYILVDGSIKTLEFKYNDDYALSYDEIVSTVEDTDFKFDLLIGGHNNNNSYHDSSAFLLKDLLVVKKSLSEDEIKEIASPLSLGVDGIRAGMELSERNIL